MSALPTLIDRARDELERRRVQRHLKEDCEADLLQFIRTFWPVLEPETQLIDGWPLEQLTRLMMAVADGHIKRLIINIPPGFSKPVWEDELVLTKRGRIRLRDVVVGDEIMTHRGRYRAVLAVHIQGELPLLRVTTEYGRTVATAADHPFLTTRGWIAAQNLTELDVLAAVTPIEDCREDDYISEEEARFLGYLIGDGGCTAGIAFTNTDPEVVADFRRCASALKIGTSVGKVYSDKIKATKINVQGALPLLRRHGVARTNSYTKRIPPAILRSSRRVIENFVGAYWSCDGTIKVRHLRERGSIYISIATTVSQGLAADLQHALLRLGINVRVRRRAIKLETKRQPGGEYIHYHVQAASHKSTVLFKGMLGLCSRKSNVLDGLHAREFVQGPLVEDEVASVVAAGSGFCRCLTVEEDESFTVNDLAVHNSLTLNVFFVAWCWGPNDQPHLRFLSASYSASLTERDNGKLVRLVTDPLYQRWWGDRVRLTKDGVGKVENTKTGWKLATSVGGTTTGERGDLVLVDDANNPQTVESDTVRDTSNRWLREVLPSRLNSVSDGVIVNLQQRTHEQDATGTLLEHGSGYAFWSIPMEYDPLRDFPLPIRWDENGNVIEQLIDPRGRDERGRRLDGLYRDLKGELKVRMGSPLAEAEGTLAWPERYPADEIRKLKTILGPYAFSGQFNQSPGIRGGGIIRRDWWRVWTRDLFPTLGTVIGSLDTAIKESEENDYNAMTTWGAFEGEEGEPQVILTGAWRKRCSLAELVQTVREFCVEKKVDWLLIEDKARGHDVAQELMRQFADDPWTIVLIPVNGRGAFSGDKVARLQAVAPMFSGDVRRDPVSGLDVWSGGMVWEPGRDWSDAVVSEVASFPRGAHDDYVDTVSQCLAYMRRHGVILRKQEWDNEELERKKYRRTPSLPYAI